MKSLKQLSESRLRPGFFTYDVFARFARRISLALILSMQGRENV